MFPYDFLLQNVPLDALQQTEFRLPLNERKSFAYRAVLGARQQTRQHCQRDLKAGIRVEQG